MYYVYKIENTKTGDLYIGSTTKPFTRWRHHFKELSKNNHNERFQKLFNTSTLTDWSFSIVEHNIKTLLEAFEKEEYYRIKLNATLNGTDRIHKIISKKNLNVSILQSIRNGMSYRQIAKEYDCSIGKISSVYTASKDYVK